jgi:hypothetical protein
MPRPKSVLKRIEVDEVLKAHNCQHNKRHRLEKGDKRLKVWCDRSNENYCVACALEIITRDIARLQDLERQLRDL